MSTEAAAMTAKPTCLTQAIIAHLREVGAPQLTCEIRQALQAKGLHNAGDVNKRVFALTAKGTLKKTEDGRNVRYEVIESPATEKLSKTVRPAAPKPVYGGFRAAVISVITAKPGLRACDIREELEELGYVVKKSEPSGALDALCRQERLRKEGVHPYRRYFINDAVASESSAAALTNKLTALVKTNPQLPAKALAAVAANATSAGATVCGTASPATNKAAGQSSIPRTEGSAVTAVKERQLSDDPIDNLANAIEQHLDLSEGWHSLTLISKELDESALDVSDAVRRLVESKRIKMFSDPSSRFRQFASLSVAGNSPHESPETLAEPVVKESLTAEPIESPSQPNPTRPTPDDVKAGTTDTAAGGEECAPLEEPAAAPVSFAVNVNGVAEKTDWHRVVRDVLPPALQAAMLGAAGVWRGPSLDVSDDRLRAEITAELSSLLSTAELVSEATALRVDIEDLVGRACDEQVDHRAIKSLVTAAFAFTRALAHLGARA